MKNLAKFICTLAFTCFVSHSIAQNNNDALLITEARIAMDKYKDCKSAVSTLNKVSSTGRQEVLFSYYMAKAYECENDNVKALKYWQEYAKRTSMTAELMEKIADLKYKTKKDNLDGSLWYPEGEPQKIRQLFIYNGEAKFHRQEDAKVLLNGVLNATGVYVEKKKFYLQNGEKFHIGNRSYPICSNYKGTRDLGTVEQFIRISSEKIYKNGIYTTQNVLYFTTYIIRGKEYFSDMYMDYDNDCILDAEAYLEKETYKYFKVD